MTQIKDVLVLGSIYPGAGLLGFSHRKHAHFARHEEAEDLHRVLDPVDICDHGYALPTRPMLNAHLEIFPGGGGIEAVKIWTDLIVESDFLVRFKPFLDGRDLHRVIIGLGNSSFTAHGQDILGEPFQ